MYQILVGVSASFQVNTGSMQDVHLMRKFTLIVFPEKQNKKQRNYKTNIAVIIKYNLLYIHTNIGRRSQT